MIAEYFLLKQGMKNHIADFFDRDSDTVLDIGAGDNPYYHSLVKGKLVKMDLNQSKNHVVGDADFLPFKDDSFDKVIMVNSFYYFRNPFNVIENVSRILRKKGRMLAIMPFMYPIHDVPDDKYRFTEHGLKTLLEDKFRVEKIKAIGGFFSLPSVILHSLLKGIPLMVPQTYRGLAKFFVYALFYIPYLLAQLFSIVDIFDRSRRWPIYYLVTATKK